jgi:hypothetical protein
MKQIGGSLVPKGALALPGSDSRRGRAVGNLRWKLADSSCSFPAPQVSERKKWAQPMTIDALGHLTPGFHHRISTNSMISITDKRANQLVLSSLVGPTNDRF